MPLAPERPFHLLRTGRSTWPKCACKAGSDFTVTVGAGHDPRTPNNVHFVNSLLTHPSVLVEDGGHGSSPDVDPYGQFQPGLDVNVHASDAWGTRDQLAMMGSGYIGRYRPEYTVTRSLEGRQFLPKGSATTEGKETYYSLVPVALLASLDTAIAEGNEHLTVELLVKLDGLLESFHFDSDTISGYHPELMSLLQTWRLPVCCGLPKPIKGHQMWEHEHYVGDATRIFKNHLFRASWQQMGAQQSLLFDNLVISALGGSSGLLGASLGFVMPTSSIRGLFIPGVLTFEAGFSQERAVDGAPKGVYLGATVDESFRGLWGLYAAVRFHQQRLDGSVCDGGGGCSEFRESLSISLGGSIMLRMKGGARHVNVFRRIRLRGGLVFPLRWGQAAESPSFEVQLVLH